MKGRDATEITQIVAAPPGWYSKHEYQDGGETRISYSPVTVWCLVKGEGGLQWVSAFSGDMDGLEDEYGGLVEYVFLSRTEIARLKRSGLIQAEVPLASPPIPGANA